MSVLINEFEVVPPAEGGAGQRPAEAAPKSDAGPSQPLRAADVHTLIRRCEERRARVCAH